MRRGRMDEKSTPSGRLAAGSRAVADGTSERVELHFESLDGSVPGREVSGFGRKEGKARRTREPVRDPC